MGLSVVRARRSYFTRRTTTYGTPIYEVEAVHQTTKRSSTAPLFTGKPDAGHWEVLQETCVNETMGSDDLQSIDVNAKTKRLSPAETNFDNPQSISEKLLDSMEYIEESSVDNLLPNTQSRSVEELLEDDDYTGTEDNLEDDPDYDASVSDLSGPVTNVPTTKKKSSSIYEFQDDEDAMYKDIPDSVSAACDDIEYDDEGIDKKANKGKKKRKTYNVDIGLVRAPSPFFKDDFGSFSHEIARDALRALMLHTVRCTCTLTFEFARSNKRGDIVFYAHCKRKHKQPYKIILDEINNAVLTISIYSTHEMKAVHEDWDAKVFQQLRGTRREEFLRQVEFGGGSKKYMSKTIEDAYRNGKEMVGEGHIQNLFSYNVA